MCGGSVLGVPSKFIKTSKQLCDSTHVFLEAEPTLIYIQVLHSSFLLWCCFWKKRCETDCFLSSSVQIAVCTPALAAVWAQLGLAIGGGEERTRVHCHTLQTIPPGSVPLSSFTSPTLFTMVNKLPVKLYNWSPERHSMGQVPHIQGVIGKTPPSKPLLSVGCCQVRAQLQQSPAVQPLLLLPLFTHRAGASCTPHQPHQKHMAGENTQQDRSCNVVSRGESNKLLPKAYLDPVGCWRNSGN